MRRSGQAALFLIIAISSALSNIGSARADYLFVSDFNADTVYLIDVDDGSTVREFSDPLFLFSPTGLALSPDGETLYVGATNASNADVYRFSTATGQRTGQYISSLTGARGLALSNDGATLYVSGIGTDEVITFNTSTGTPTAAITSGLSNPQGIHLAPDGNSLFIANSSANNAVQRGLPGGSLVQQFNPPGSFYAPSDVLLSPDASTLYVSTFGDSAATNNQLLRFDASTGSFLGSWTVPDPDGDLYGMAISPDGSRLFVSDIFNGRIFQVDTATGVADPFQTSDALSAPAFLLYVPDGVISSVPEPSTFAMTGAGLVVISGLLWRRRRRTADLT